MTIRFTPWTCSCGTQNRGEACRRCGRQREWPSANVAIGECDAREWDDVYEITHRPGAWALDLSRHASWRFDRQWSQTIVGPFGGAGTLLRLTAIDTNATAPGAHKPA